MKSLLKKFHIKPNQSEDSEGSTSSKGNHNRLSDASSNESYSHHGSDHNKPFSAISGWLNSVTSRRSPSPPSSSNVKTGEREEAGGARAETFDPASVSALDAALDAVRRDSGSNNSRDPDIEEEYQIQLALELSAREDPEAVQIEAVKQISLGSCPPENTPAEVIAYRYWNYNALSYDDRILDGFYDLYGILTGSNSSRMPSLVELQGMPVSNDITWEAVLVNRAADAKLLRLEQKALEVAVKSGSESLDFAGYNLVQRLAVLVSNHMGGPVEDPDKMLISWRSLSYKLKATLGSMVLPLGSLKVGLARHRALLFKVLADSVGIPCRLVKGQQYTGSSDVAMNFVRIADGREYIVDLMADPGTLIPSDVAGSSFSQEESVFSSGTCSKDGDLSRLASSTSGIASLPEEHSEFETKKYSQSDPSDIKKSKIIREMPERPSYPLLHARSPSWTEGVSSPVVRKMKVKDVSQYMIDAAKENPKLAQKLHDVLLESGVVAPPDLFTKIYEDESTAIAADDKSSLVEREETQRRDESRRMKGQDDVGRAKFLPPLPYPKGNHFKQQESSQGEQHTSSEVTPAKYAGKVPVAAIAAAAAAAAASSMVVAAARTAVDSNVEIPVAAAATATAAAVVATTAAVGKQYENLESRSPTGLATFFIPGDLSRTDEVSTDEPQVLSSNPEGERISDWSTGNESAKSDTGLDDVADCEIPWEDITLGERIGLGSYGEVYRGDWHGTEVAVKKFLDQAITNESLAEFRSEVHIMKKVRHPNVVLFMGAVTRAPHLSIITEFLPRGSLYRLIHRPNNQLEIRRRLRMALDAARGMNYLHNCTPVIVHRDLKSPNLLVDKNWVVKVGDFGLSRMKHSTFLSSRSTAGTAEWMAPEVLRNEPSDEKCDVFSFGVILWELCTMQQPWGGMNPMQVVGAVGFQHRRLDIPDDMDPVISDIIRSCWQTDPRLRPSFAEIMAALKPLQKPIASTQASRG